MIVVEGVVGKKGELYPPKEIREALNLKSGQKVIFRVERDKLIVEPVLSVSRCAEDEEILPGRQLKNFKRKEVEIFK